ncbi:MAG TPA: hypothetical protein VKV28_00390 [Candidatus Binataceae bacterium]|nr:hypothetical protein [Candidatus Binataceae bacterium]
MDATIPAASSRPAPSAAPSPSAVDPETQKMRRQAAEWNVPAPALKPLGFAAPGLRSFQPPAWAASSGLIPFEDRWRIGFPDWNRYVNGTPGEYPYRLGRWWDPYDQNVIKGDYPIWGQHTFFDFTAVSDTIAQFDRTPTASGVSAQPTPGFQNFFGGGNERSLQQNFITSFDLFHGDAGFKPLDWELRFTPVFNVNYLDVSERGVVNVNPADGTTRLDGHVGIQELFFQYKLLDLSPNYDFVSARAGIQPLVSDFRGFIYVDQEPGVRLFGNYDDNKINYNLAFFEQLDKDTNSGLNTVFRTRGQQVVVANLTRQDFFFSGYDAQLDFDYNHDAGGFHYDNNGFLVRPALVGSVVAHTINAAYFGLTGQGHIGPIEISHAFYETVGSDSFNQIAGHAVNINAQMAALELAYPRDWLTYKVSFFYASGDGNLNSHTATGFDAILDSPDFAGAPFSYWSREGIGLPPTGVALKSPFSLLPNLRSSELQGQANFVNPGLLLYNLGLEARLTPELTAVVNLNYVQFAAVGVLEQLLHQNNLSRDMGFDTSVGLIYRPLLIDNVIFEVGGALFTPDRGFSQIYTSQELYSVFTAMTVTY